MKGKKTTKSNTDMSKKLEADTSKKSDVEPKLSKKQAAGNIFAAFSISGFGLLCTIRVPSSWRIIDIIPNETVGGQIFLGMGPRDQLG
jgi:hypothetical protein